MGEGKATKTEVEDEGWTMGGEKGTDKGGPAGTRVASGLVVSHMTRRPAQTRPAGRLEAFSFY